MEPHYTGLQIVSSTSVTFTGLDHSTHLKCLRQFMISDHYKPVKRLLKVGDPRTIKQPEKSRRKRCLSLFLIFHSLLSSPESRRLSSLEEVQEKIVFDILWLETQAVIQRHSTFYVIFRYLRKNESCIHFTSVNFFIWALHATASL